MMRDVGGVRMSIDQSWLAKGLGLLCWGFKGVQEETPSEEASTLQIGSVAFSPGQYTSPQLHPCHRLRLASRQLLTVQTLLPVTFGYSLSSQAVVMRQLRRWKRLWRRSLTRSHKRTSMGHCTQRRLLRRGLEFYVCTINKSAYTKKVWKLIVCTSYLWKWVTQLSLSGQEDHISQAIKIYIDKLKSWMILEKHCNWKKKNVCIHLEESRISFILIELIE